jgi:hypothetical protein
VFHPDGTVRDPAIVAALFGMFRDRDADVMPSVPDREGAVTRAVSNNKKWLADSNAGWDDGLDLAEISANLLEAGQLIAMNDPRRERWICCGGARRIWRRCGRLSKGTRRFWSRTNCRLGMPDAEGRRRSPLTSRARESRNRSFQ